MADELKIGDHAPDFSLPNENGKSVSLKSLRGKTVILYFYPKDDTPGCTREACGFRDASPSIKKVQSVVLGISTDDAASHQKFIEKYKLTFSLLSDAQASVSKAYGVYRQKSMYGKTYWGIERSTFIIDETGKIKAIYRKVRVDGHVEEIMNALKA
jgi:peroxiredoxin Q/BCP